ncbi:MAG TPA: Rrf2 family transcriptional regulator [Bacteroidia bacterium]|jgi:Rrf2 family iron-sulfur cluster assembly transcriptional regulator|nr:Rrf2 family transcriptional regulator [Bacteroidia bacterium]
MILSKSCQYGVRALLYIGMKSEKSGKTELNEIAEDLDIPKPYLAKIMQQLVKRGLARSTKGPNGGFYMTVKEKEKTLLNVIEAVDGLEYFTRCGLGMEYCDPKKPCPLHSEMVRIRTNMTKTFGKYTIEKMGQKVKKGDFAIAR